MAKPLKYRKLKAEMEMKEISVTALAKKARMHITTASLVLNGQLVSPLKLEKLKSLIERWPTPSEPSLA